MKRANVLTGMICVFFLQANVWAQSQDDPPKFEVAAEFTSLEREGFSQNRTEAGFGGRFTFNLNRSVAFETATYFLPKRCFNCRNDGNVIEVFGGVKVGKRFENWGVFAKARPGIVSFSQGAFDIVPVGNPTFPFSFEINRVTTFAADVGGVLEFYPSKHIVTRFDAGDTIIHFNSRDTQALRFDPATGGFFFVPSKTPARTAHSFQFMASVGFRF